MIYENDKLNIPEKYRNMSIPELKCEKERVYKQLKKTSYNRETKENEHKSKTLSFHF